MNNTSSAKKFLKFWDERFDAYKENRPMPMFLRDALAGTVVALIAVPLGIGIAVASGVSPTTGIIAAAFACIIGSIFGGSKFQVYGPTAAFIPIVAGIVHRFDVPFLVLACLISGAIIVLMSLLRCGRFFSLVPHSVIVGFTIGIASTITVSQLRNVLGETENVGHTVFQQLSNLPDMFVHVHAHALVIAIFTYFCVRKLNQVSVFIPAALIAMLVSTFVANNVWHDHLIPIISMQYGDIGQNLFSFIAPSLGNRGVHELLLPVLSIVLVAALESLLSAKMADRMANNTGTPFDSNKELFGQGIVNLVVPFVSGLPCTGALARTAANIKLGGVSPLSGLVNGVTVLLLVGLGANFLEMVPMAFLGGLLMYVAFNMVKRDELALVIKTGKLEIFFTLYTAAVTLIADLAVAVVSATVLYHVARRIPQLDRRKHRQTIVDRAPANTQPRALTPFGRRHHAEPKSHETKSHEAKAHEAKAHEPKMHELKMHHEGKLQPVAVAAVANDTPSPKVYF